MAGLDTNALVLRIVDGDPRQAVRVQRLFEDTHGQGTPLFVPNTIMLELEWVLRSRYKIDKSRSLQ